MSKGHDVGHVVQVSSNFSERCEHCDFFLEELPISINHYIEKHGYRLLHVGTETTRDNEGNPWQTTVAILGK